LQLELGPKGVYVQVVAPAATATEIWGRSGMPAPDTMMSADDLVDAALVGFDGREPITFPSLSNSAYWDAVEATRLAMAQNVRNAKPGARYLTPGAAD
jgi:short-subunit dehydrogenase